MKLWAQFYSLRTDYDKLEKAYELTKVLNSLVVETEDTESILEDRKSKESKSYPKGVNTAKRLSDIDDSSEERFLATALKYGISDSSHNIFL